MSYPLISEYIVAIMAAEDNFKELTNHRPVLNDDGKPVMTSGNFAVVFKMQDVETGKFYALKCFTKEQEGRAEAYHQIADALKDVDSPYLVSLRYLDKELFVDTEQTSETEFPVLLMDWVEGKTLDKYLRENLDDKYALEMLAYRFSQLAQWLIPQPFAHGDLKPVNILVREDGTLVLVDYDGMYVPSMKGQKARELGSPNFRHPQRTEDDFNERIDDFPLVSILLSLYSISIEPQLLEEFGIEDRLLLSENDYRNTISSGLISKCACVKKLPNYYPITKRLTRYLWDLLVFDDKNDISLDLSVAPPVPLNNRITYISSHDRVNCKMYDKIGYAKYSSDETKLLSFFDKHCGSYLGDIYEDPFSDYIVKTGTITICDNAFKDCHELRFLTIPDTVKYVGHGAFAGCYMKYIELPLVDYINEDAFVDCPYLHTIVIPIGTFLLFSKMLPNNTHQLREINKNVYCNRIRLHLSSNKEITSFDMTQSLFNNVSTFCFLQNSEKISYSFHKNNDGSCNVAIEEHDSFHSYNEFTHFYIKNTEDVDELSHSIYCLLLDAGLFNSDTYFRQYLNRL